MTEHKTSPNWNTSLGINWYVVAYLILSPIAAIGGVIAYSYFNGVHISEPIHFAILYYGTGLGITAGFHRYYAHKSHEAHPIVQMFYLITGAMCFQQPVLVWARNHRLHHKYSDTDLDPHNIKKGFLYAHMGWIAHKTSYESDFSLVGDLKNNKLVLWQQKYYWWIALGGGIALSTAIGAIFGRPLGGLLWGFALRLVIQNQVIFSINSVAHTFGKQTYSKKFEARDSWLLALISNGEGYHSFHHRFASDYRNGWRWFHFDPSKWFIGSMSWLGLTRNLKRTPKEKILAARLDHFHEVVPADVSVPVGDQSQNGRASLSQDC